MVLTYSFRSLRLSTAFVISDASHLVRHVGDTLSQGERGFQTIGNGARNRGRSKGEREIGCRNRGELVTKVSISGGEVALHEVTANRMPAGKVVRNVNGKGGNAQDQRAERAIAGKRSIASRLAPPQLPTSATLTRTGSQRLNGTSKLFDNWRFLTLSNPGTCPDKFLLMSVRRDIANRMFASRDNISVMRRLCSSQKPQNPWVLDIVQKPSPTADRASKNNMRPFTSSAERAVVRPRSQASSTSPRLEPVQSSFA
jgi:hypothetical protein